MPEEFDTAGILRRGGGRRALHPQGCPADESVTAAIASRGTRSWRSAIRWSRSADSPRLGGTVATPAPEPAIEIADW